MEKSPKGILLPMLLEKSIHIDRPLQTFTKPWSLGLTDDMDMTPEITPTTQFVSNLNSN